jgi:hypothetical protein
MTPLFFSSSNRRGMVGFLAVLFLLLLLGTISSTIVLQASAKYRQSARMRAALALETLARSGLDRARAELRRSPNWSGAGPLTLEPGEVEIRVEQTANHPSRIRVRAAVPTFEKPAHTLERETLLDETLTPRVLAPSLNSPLSNSEEEP